MEDECWTTVKGRSAAKSRRNTSNMVEHRPGQSLLFFFCKLSEWPKWFPLIIVFDQCMHSSQNMSKTQSSRNHKEDKNQNFMNSLDMQFTLLTFDQARQLWLFYRVTTTSNVTVTHNFQHLEPCLMLLPSLTIFASEVVLYFEPLLLSWLLILTTVLWTARPHIESPESV